MLSDETLKLLKLASHLLYYSGAAPLKWTKSKSKNICDRIFLQESGHLKFLIGCHFSAILFYECFMTYRVSFALLYQPQNRNQISKSESQSTILQVVWNLLAYSVPLLAMGNNLLYWEEIPAFTNSCLNFFESFKENFLKKFDQNMKNGCERTLKIMFGLGLLIAFQNLVLILNYPERPYFLTSLLNEPQSASLIKKLPLILIQGWVWLSCWSHVYYYSFNLFSYAYPTVFLLGQLRRNLPNSTSPTLRRTRDPRNFVKLYRSLQTLHSLFNFCFQSVFFPFHKFVAVNISIIGIYGAIRIPGARAIIMAVTAVFSLLYLSLIFRRMGMIYESSRIVLQSWKYEERKYLRKFLRSSQPIRVEVGYYYCVTKTTVIVIWATVFNFTTNMLLSFRMDN